MTKTSINVRISLGSKILEARSAVRTIHWYAGITVVAYRVTALLERASWSRGVVIHDGRCSTLGDGHFPRFARSSRTVTTNAIAKSIWSSEYRSARSCLSISACHYGDRIDLLRVSTRHTPVRFRTSCQYLPPLCRAATCGEQLKAPAHARFC
jgi:hypothetical protein